MRVNEKYLESHSYIYKRKRFIDSPYSDNIKCSDHLDNIGNISCEDTKFFEELDKVAKEIYRILKP